MNFQEFRAKWFELGCLSSNQVYAWQPDFDKNNMGRWVKKGLLIKLRNGFYTFPEYKSKPGYAWYIANRIYRPSYISLHSALAFYGMIPERVSEITSATSKNEKLFDTQIGRFSYKKTLLQAYSLGVDWFDDENDGGRFIATREKALCDKIRYDRGIGTLTQNAMLQYLKYDLRLEITTPLDNRLIEEIATAYRSKNLKTLAQLVYKGKL